MSESVGVHERVNSRETCSMSESVGVHERVNPVRRVVGVRV